MKAFDLEGLALFRSCLSAVRTAVRGRGVRPARLSSKQEVDEKEARAHTERRVGHVEGRPMIRTHVGVQVVEDAAEANPIDEVAERSSEKEPIAREENGPRVCGRQNEPEYHEERDARDEDEECGAPGRC